MKHLNVGSGLGRVAGHLGGIPPDSPGIATRIATVAIPGFPLSSIAVPPWDGITVRQFHGSPLLIHFTQGNVCFSSRVLVVLLESAEKGYFYG